jgi:hypothetical protein
MYNVTDVNDIFNTNKDELSKIFQKVTEKNFALELDTNILNNINSVEKSIKSLFNEFVVTDEYNMENIISFIDNKENDIHKNINDKFDIMNKKINNITNKLTRIYLEENYNHVARIFYLTYYLFNLLFSGIKPTGEIIKIPFDEDIRDNGGAQIYDSKGSLIISDNYPMINEIGYPIINTFPYDLNGNILINNGFTRDNTLIKEDGTPLIMPLEYPEFMDDNFIYANKFIMYKINNTTGRIENNNTNLINELLNILNDLFIDINNDNNNYYSNEDFIKMKYFINNHEDKIQIQNIHKNNFQIDIDTDYENPKNIPIIIDKHDFEIPSDIQNMPYLYLINNFNIKISKDDRINKTFNQEIYNNLYEKIKYDKNIYLNENYILRELKSIKELDEICKKRELNNDPDIIDMVQNIQDGDISVSGRIARFTIPNPNDNNNYLTVYKNLFETNINNNDNNKITWIMLKIIENNLPNGFNINIGNYNYDNKQYIYSNIKSLVIYIDQQFELIKSEINSFPKNKLQEVSIKMNIYYFNNFYNELINILVNLYLLEKYTSLIDKVKQYEILKKLKEEFNNISTDETYHEYSRKLIEIHFNEYFEYVEHNFNDFMEKHKKNEFEIINEEIYQEILNIMDIINELVISFNEYQSVVYLKKLYEFTKNTSIISPVSIDNFYSNKFYINFKNKFPKTFKDFKNKYVDIINSTTNKDEIIKNLYPYYFDYSYNNIYSNFIDFSLHYINEDSKIVENKELYIDPLPLIFKLNLMEKKINTLKTDKKTIDIRKQNINKYNLDLFNFTSGYGNFFSPLINYKKVNNEYIFIKDDKKTKPFKFNITNNPNLSMELVKYLLNYSYTINGYDNLEIISLKYPKQLISIIFNQILSDIYTNNFYKSLFDIENDISKNINENIKEQYNLAITYIKNNEDSMKNIIKLELIDFINMYIKIMIDYESNNILDTYINDCLGKILPDKFKKETIKNLDNIILNKKNVDIKKLINSKYEEKNTSVLTTISFLTNTSLFTKSDNIKLIENKCVTIDKVKIENILKKINLRLKDINGNTILNRMINQYNINAIDILLKLDKNLKTYKNLKDQTSLEYIISLINNIQKDYINLDSRLKSYAQVLQDEINKNEKNKEIVLDKELIIYNIILNSIYLFNEFIWVKIQQYSNFWSINTNIKKLLNITSEELLIKTFDDTDAIKLNEKVNENFNSKDFKEKINNLKKEIADIDNALKNINDSNNSNLITKNDMTTYYDNLKKNKETELDNYEKILKSPTNLEFKFDQIKNSILIKNNNINYIEYNKLINDININYLNILDIINKKVDTNIISISQLKLLDLNKNNVDENIVLLNDYYQLINNIYAEYEDLDKYENSDYNTINSSILSIIKINCISTISYELLKILVKVIISEYDNNIITDFKNNIEKEIGNIPSTSNPQQNSWFNSLFNYVINLIFNKKSPTNKNDNIIINLYNLIKDYLTLSMYIKLKITNPDKPVIDIQSVKLNLLTNIYKLFGIPVNELEPNSEKLEDIINILDIYTNLSDNVSLSIYEELVKLLTNLKRVSLLLEIYNKLKD